MRTELSLRDHAYSITQNYLLLSATGSIVAPLPSKMIETSCNLNFLQDGKKMFNLYDVTPGLVTRWTLMVKNGSFISSDEILWLVGELKNSKVKPSVADID